MARGEDRPPTCRVAGRGSGGVYPDPRDLEEIRRLRQRVRDLEEIERLRKRVRDLESQRKMCKVETESSTVVWDEGGDEEQHPFGHSHPQFDELIYQDYLSENKPSFDEDEFDFDEGEYLFVEQAISGVKNGSGPMVVISGQAAEDISPMAAMVDPYVKPDEVHIQIGRDLTTSLVNLEIQKEIKYQNMSGEDFLFVDGTHTSSTGASKLLSGTSKKLSNTSQEVELFGCVIIRINKNRVDVPFDPGGVDPEAKLEDEFFKDGEYDAEH